MLMLLKPNARPRLRNGESGGQSRSKRFQSSRMRLYICLAVALLIFLGVFALLVPHAGPTRKVHGYVLSENEPVEGARVRFQGDFLGVSSKSDGAFQLPVLSDCSKRITAWKE